jgi:hypothetical protein
MKSRDRNKNMKKKLSCLKLIGACLFTLSLYNCKNERDPNHTSEIIAIDQLTEIPKSARFVSINEKMLSSLLTHLTEVGIKDTTLRRSPNSLLITSSLNKENQYLVHPPLHTLYNLLPLEVSAKNNVVTFQPKCPSKFKQLCDCANNPKQGCPIPIDDTDLNPSLNRICGTSLLAIRGGLSCQSTRSCTSPSSRCIPHFNNTTNRGLQILIVECRCN